MSDFFIESPTIYEFEILEVTTSWIRGLAENDHSFSFEREKGFDRISSHIGIDRYGIYLISFKYLNGILFGG